MSRVPRISGAFASHRAAFALLLLLAVSVSLHAMRDISERRALYEAAARESLDGRLASVGAELESSFSTEREEFRLLGAVLAIYANQTNASDYSLRALDIAHQKHPEYLFTRFVRTDGSVFAELPLFDGEESLPKESGDQFSALLSDARSSGEDTILVSGLKWYQAPDGSLLPILYAVVPTVAGGTTYGYLEVMVDMRSPFSGVAQAERSEEGLMLLDNHGAYLVAPPGTPSQQRTAYDGYPKAVTDRFYGPAESGSFTYGSAVYSYRHIEVAGFGEQPGERQYWVLASVSDTASVFTAARRAVHESLLAAAVLLMLVSLIAFATAHARRKGSSTP